MTAAVMVTRSDDGGDGDDEEDGVMIMMMMTSEQLHSNFGAQKIDRVCCIGPLYFIRELRGRYKML